MFAFWQVGSDFGYFPKDLLEINHNYSNEELELPTDVSLICYFLIGLLPISYLGNNIIINIINKNP